MTCLICAKLSVNWNCRQMLLSERTVTTCSRSICAIIDWWNQNFFWRQSAIFFYWNTSITFTDVTQASIGAIPMPAKELFKVVGGTRASKGFRFDSNQWKDILVDCPENEGKPACLDKPIVHDALRMIFGSDDIFDWQQWYSCRFHHLKVDYEDGQKWNHCSRWFWRAQASLPYLGRKWVNRWLVPSSGTRDQPRALIAFVDIQELPWRGIWPASIHCHVELRIYMGEGSAGLIRYNSMADYVDVESINAQMLLDQASHLRQAVGKPNHVTFSYAHAMDASLNTGFNRDAMVEDWEIL